MIADLVSRNSKDRVSEYGFTSTTKVYVFILLKQNEYTVKLQITKTVATCSLISMDDYFSLISTHELFKENIF